MLTLNVKNIKIIDLLVKSMKYSQLIISLSQKYRSQSAKP